MPSLAKVYRHHILPSTLFTKIRSRFSSNHSNDPPFSELTEIEKAEPRRKKGPYSIPTTRDLISQSNDLELSTVPSGYQKPIPSIQASQLDRNVEAGYIQKDMSWEQKSYTRTSKS